MKFLVDDSVTVHRTIAHSPLWIGHVATMESGDGEKMLAACDGVIQMVPNAWVDRDTSTPFTPPVLNEQVAQVPTMAFGAA
jgi:hypothetical protein